MEEYSYLPVYSLHDCFDFNRYCQYMKREYDEEDEYNDFCSNDNNCN